MIIITSDHGEELWEHDGFEHGHSVYNEVIKIPLYFISNHLSPKEIKNYVSMIDIFPTILDHLKINSANLNFEGHSLRPLFMNKKIKENTIFSFGTLYGSEKYSIIHQKIKLIQNTKDSWKKRKLIGEKDTPEFELYDLSNDPYETKNIFPDSHSQNQLLKKILTRLKNKDNFHATELRNSKDQIKELKSLGYIN